jgi:hypothetical protein
VKKQDQDKVLAGPLKGETVIELPMIIVYTRETINGYKMYEEGDNDSEEITDTRVV